eukprot:GHVR01177901.1.p3 GENE.GHVR01177901.1~~GHVR01177901.1.p3  ORF type:complete len:127 (+),score=61.24 GHVR01177901.1:1345-1725(+)
MEEGVVDDLPGRMSVWVRLEDDSEELIDLGLVHLKAIKRRVNEWKDGESVGVRGVGVEGRDNKSNIDIKDDDSDNDWDRRSRDRHRDKSRNIRDTNTHTHTHTHLLLIVIAVKERMRERVTGLQPL